VSTISESDLGITPELQMYLRRAAKAVRRAIVWTEGARSVIHEGTDADVRCAEVMEELEGALSRLEWSPSSDVDVSAPGLRLVVDNTRAQP